MTTKKQPTTNARAFLQEITGAPLSLAQLIRAIRQGEDWSLAQMGDKLGVSRGFVAQLERGHKAVSVHKASQYAKALGYSEQQFVRLALQDQLNRANLHYTLSVEPAVVS